MGRAPCCDKANVKKGPWSPEEDAKLKAYIDKYGTGGNWIALPQKIGTLYTYINFCFSCLFLRMICIGEIYFHVPIRFISLTFCICWVIFIGLKRCGKSCRLRWLNYLRPNIKHGGFSEEEDNIICSLYISIGSRYTLFSLQLLGLDCLSFYSLSSIPFTKIYARPQNSTVRSFFFS